MLQGFKERFQEFEQTDDRLINFALNEAEQEVDQSTWGDRYRSGVFYLAAHKLACSPFGEAMRLAGKENETIYLKEYSRMLKSLGFGIQAI